MANNHVLDWGYEGLRETLSTLKKSSIQFAGAGETLADAMQPSIFKLPINKRILVFSAGTETAGVPSAWLATSQKPGIYYLDSLNTQSVVEIGNNIRKYKLQDDIVLFSIHWGSNWGYDVPDEFQSFAHALIDKANVDLVFGHSSHHFRPIEIYHNKPIFYGCGDFINDYEGISGHDEYRNDLCLMYFVEFNQETLQCDTIALIPLKIEKFSLKRTNDDDMQWVTGMLNDFKFNSTFDISGQEIQYKIRQK